ncbi:MAG TPA: class I SAM-dependent methyltransferase [Candidatus Paceibacterota bacterium]|nr:class I SAM-dependent methyltransferase [Candidatus Paceibacterota bacterium]
MLKLLRITKRILDKIFGTKINEVYWKFRHIFDSSWAESYISKENIKHPHREILIEKISAYRPFSKVLEIGCASAPNLYLLAKKFPETKFYGIDISKKAIETGKHFLKKENISNIFLKASKAENILEFSDKSIDLIFTDAVLIYEDPKRIVPLIRNMIKVSKKAIILCEQHTESSQYYKDHWVHNYKKLFSKFVSKEKIKITKIQSDVWSGDWGKLGYIIEIKLI